MNNRVLALAVLSATLAVSGVVVRSQPAPGDQPTSRPTTRPMMDGRGEGRGPGGPGGPGGAQPMAPNLERSMNGMNRAIHQVQQLIDDPANDARTIAAINDLQVATTQAKAALPPRVARQPEGDQKQQAITDFHERLIAVLRVEIELEEAVLENKRDDAKAKLAELQQQEKDGHDAYGVKTREGPGGPGGLGGPGGPNGPGGPGGGPGGPGGPRN